jgi:hypothetical protein
VSDRIDQVIGDEALRRLARQRSTEVVPVLIEVDEPSAPAEIELGRRRETVTGRTTSIPVTVPTQAAATAEAVRVLTDVFGRTPPYLRAAHAFVSRATGAQLAALAASPLVRAISPDRHVRVVRHRAGTAHRPGSDNEKSPV